MSSKRRIDASRRNGALSRGPATEEGRRRSSRNNLRHGILANTVVLDDEDKAFFIEFLSTLEDEHQPADQTDLDLVETMAVARWRMRRIWAMEKANLQAEMAQDHTPVPDRATRASRAFRKLSDESRSIDLLGALRSSLRPPVYRALNLLLKKRALSSSPAPDNPLSPLPNSPESKLPFEPNPEIEHTGSESPEAHVMQPSAFVPPLHRRDVRRRAHPRPCRPNILHAVTPRRLVRRGGLCMSPFHRQTHQND